MTVRRVERVRATNDLSVAQMTLTELQAEVRRRVRNLLKQREELQERLASVELELEKVSQAADPEAALAGGLNGVSRKRRMSAEEYRAAVREVLEQGRKYSTSEICEALLDAGYNAKKTTLSQRMVGHLVEIGVLSEQGKRGRANQYALEDTAAE